MFPALLRKAGASRTWRCSVSFRPTSCAHSATRTDSFSTGVLSHRKSEFAPSRKTLPGASLNGPLKNAISRSSRGDEAQIPSETEAICEPPHVGCYFLNGLLTGLRDVGAWKYRLKRWNFRVILQCHERLGIE